MTQLQSPNKQTGGWHGYALDRHAQKLVLKAKERDDKSLGQAFKMRQTVAYGLERFWGEQIRLKDKEPDKAKYWRCTWKALAEIVEPAGIYLPTEKVKAKNAAAIEQISQQLWGEAPVTVAGREHTLTYEDRQVVLAVLTQLCDCLVWWTQRYKG
ncbi:MAG: hypothetical protein ACPGVO_16945 [Spirulinaceae cyanobacterium]